MSEQNDALQNPFSPENAWLTYQNNMKEAKRLKEEVLREKEAGNASDRELVIMAADALGRLTDNTILKRVVQKALEAREGA